MCVCGGEGSVGDSVGYYHITTNSTEYKAEAMVTNHYIEILLEK